MTTIKEAIAQAKLGDLYQAANGKKAVFLRFAKNSEYEFAYFYVDGWGWVQVFKDTGKEVNEDVEHSIVGFWKENSTSKELDEAAEKFAWEKEEPLADGERLSCKFSSNINAFKAGAKWQAERQPILAGLNYAAPTYLTNTDMEQGEIIEGSMGFEPHIKAPIVMLDTAPSFYDGHSQKVIIQIRRKDD